MPAGSAERLAKPKNASHLAFLLPPPPSHSCCCRSLPLEKGPKRGLLQFSSLNLSGIDCVQDADQEVSKDEEEVEERSVKSMESLRQEVSEEVPKDKIKPQAFYTAQTLWDRSVLIKHNLSCETIVMTFTIHNSHNSQLRLRRLRASRRTRFSTQTLISSKKRRWRSLSTAAG